MTAPKHYPEEDANGWIALSKRKPTMEDADEHGDVVWVHPKLGKAVGPINPNEDWTHWKPAGPGPVVETEEERQAREDEQVLRYAMECGDTVREAFYRALAHARRERK